MRQRETAEDAAIRAAALAKLRGERATGCHAASGVSRQPRLVLDAGALIDVEAHPRGETFRSCVKAFEDG